MDEEEESKIEQYKSNPIIQKQLEFVNDLAENHKEIAKSITKYTHDDKFYKTMNTNLLRKKRQPKEIQVDLDNIDEAFKAVPPLTEPLVVYRGKRKDEINKTDLSFVSTSLFSDTTVEFTGIGCCILQITISPGSKVLPIYDISENQSEFEILLDRGGQFIVTGSEIKQITSIDEGRDMKIIYVSYVPKIYEQTTLLSEIVDLEKLDETQIQESIITYFTGMKLRYNSEEEVNTHLNKLMIEENLTLSPETIDAVKLRLGISKSCMRQSKEMFCKKDVPSQFPEDILKLTIENVNTPIMTPLPSNLRVLIFNRNYHVPLPSVSHTKLIFLDCSLNQLTELPEMPSTLEVLNCSFNDLVYLPDLSHTKLTKLNYTDNYIEKLPLLPETVKKENIRGEKFQKKKW